MIATIFLQLSSLVKAHDQRKRCRGYMIRCVIVVFMLIGSQTFDPVSRKTLAAGDDVEVTRKTPAASALRLTRVAVEAHSRALGEIFADDHVVDAALGIHERATAMSPQDRFTFLTQWVLPNNAHTSLRLQLAFSPTYSAQAEGEPTGAGEKRISNGGAIICPALDLLDIATQLNKLVFVRTALAKIKPRNRLEEKQLAAFRCLVELAANNMDGALADCDAFLKLTKSSDPHNSQNRADEMLLMLKASTTPELKEAIADYVRQVLVPERWPTYMDVWSRQAESGSMDDRSDRSQTMRCLSCISCRSAASPLRQELAVESEHLPWPVSQSAWQCAPPERRS